MSAERGARATIREVAAALGGGLVVQDARGEIVEVNDRAACILQVAPDELIGSSPPVDGRWRVPIIDGHAGSWSESVEQPYAVALRTGQPARARVGVPMQDGTIRWLDVGSIPLCEPPDLPRGVASVFLDVTGNVATCDRLAAVERIAHVASWEWWIDRKAVDWSPRLLAMLGLTPDRASGEVPSLEEIVHPDDLDRVRRTLADARHAEAPFSMEMRVRREDGARQIVVCRGEPVIGPTGGLLSYCGTMADVTESRGREARLRDREEQLRALIDTSPDLIVRLDREFRHVHVNHAAASMVGLEAGTIVGRGLDALGAPPRLVDCWTRELHAVLDSGEASTFEWSVRLSDEDLWFESHAAPEFGEDGGVTHIVVVSRDVTERRRASEALIHQATHDGLTGLPNRRVLLDALAGMTEAHAAGRYAVLVLDVDRFKLVNDMLGHPMGDAVLIAVAQRLRAAVRDGDFVGRLGGDEFVILALDIEDDAEARRFAERLLSALRDPMLIDGQEFRPSVSIGIARPEGTTLPTELLSRADAAMYLAKERGRDRVEFFDRELQSRAAVRVAIDTALRHALARDELRVHYQPEVDLHTGEILAFEALVRWERPGASALTAGSFVQVAEESELVVDLGRRVLELVARDLGQWRGDAEGAPAAFRINLSARELADRMLVDRVRAVLGETGAPPGSLGFELTETSLMSDTPTVRANLMGLAALGVPIAIDDFGSGYSSLAYLKRLPVAAIKIDRSFVENLPTSPTDASIVEAVVAIGHNLDVAVIAEGVETEAQRDALLALGCTRAQGFLFGAAMPASDLTRVLLPAP